MFETARKLTLCLVILSVSFIFLSCSPKKISLYERFTSSREYRESFRKYTRSKKVYSGLETRFIIYSTYLSPQFQRAVLSELYKMYYLDEERKRAHEKYIVEESKGKARFFVALFTPDDRLNDLDREDGHWSVRLVTGDEKSYSPVSVGMVKLSEEEIDRIFPLEDTRWYKFYDVTFELPGEVMEKLEDSFFKLVFLSPLGRAVLVYTPK